MQVYKKASTMSKCKKASVKIQLQNECKEKCNCKKANAEYANINNANVQKQVEKSKCKNASEKKQK